MRPYGEKKKDVATYHCSVKVGGAGKGAAHDEYLRREGRYKDGDRYEDLEYAGYGNMPKWAEHNPAYFWQAADTNERKNGSVYREFEIALPRELTPDQRRELVQEIIRQEIGDKHAYTVAIHCPKASLEGGEQPHAHIMYSERTIDGIARDPEQYFRRANKSKPENGGCVKSDRFSGGKTAEQRKESIKKLRANVAEITNKHLERHGHNSRVDHRSLKDQGINREPERHLGGSGVRQHGTYIKKIREEHQVQITENNDTPEKEERKKINMPDHDIFKTVRDEHEKRNIERAEILEKLKAEREEERRQEVEKYMIKELEKEKEREIQQAKKDEDERNHIAAAKEAYRQILHRDIDDEKAKSVPWFIIEYKEKYDDYLHQANEQISYILKEDGAVLDDLKKQRSYIDDELRELKEPSGFFGIFSRKQYDDERKELDDKRQDLNKEIWKVSSRIEEIKRTSAYDVAAQSMRDYHPFIAVKKDDYITSENLERKRQYELERQQNREQQNTKGMRR